MTDNTQIITNVSYMDAQYLIDSQLSTANYLLPTQMVQEARYQPFYSNEDMWNAIIDERLRSGAGVTLENYHLMEWFPRSPGLYFTNEGHQSREVAKYNVEKMDLNESESQYAVGVDGEKVTVYNPYGKVAMLKGGLGTIRLKPKQADNRQMWFMCATANGVAHEGIPLLVSDEIYMQCIDLISTRGSWSGTIVGKLRFISDRLVSLYSDYQGVPQLYMEVEKISPAKGSAFSGQVDTAVSVAVSFSSCYEGQDKLYASYVFFNPSRKGSLDRNINWMQETYVEGAYKGKIITDFDEHKSRFADATFSLEKVMDGTLDQMDIDQTLEKLNLPGDTKRLFKQIASACTRRIIINGDIITQGNGNIIALDSQLEDIKIDVSTQD